jgi:hypothetical protein
MLHTLAFYLYICDIIAGKKPYTVVDLRYPVSYALSFAALIVGSIATSTVLAGIICKSLTYKKYQNKKTIST